MKIFLPEKKSFFFVKKVYGLLNPRSYTVQLGVHDRYNLDSWAVKRGVSKVILHERYNDRMINYDIALLKLDVKYQLILHRTYYKIY
jgi:hypothetical protein